MGRWTNCGARVSRAGGVLRVGGIGIALRYGISYWDGAIVAAAERLKAAILYTEDLSHGQRYGSVVVVNPFLSAAPNSVHDADSYS